MQECYRVSQSVTECYRVLQNFTECYKALQSVTECYRVLQSVTECYRVLQSISSASTWTNFWACLYGIFLDQNKVRKNECLKLDSKREKYAVFVLSYPNYASRKKIPNKIHFWMITILGGP